MAPGQQPAAVTRTLVATLCTLALAGCSSVTTLWSGREQLDKPPNARGLIIEYRALLWRDLASIRRASITEPQRDAERDLWRVCVRLDIKGSLGRYTGERDYVVALYGVAKRPELLMEDASFCAALPHETFPELEGGYTISDPKGTPAADPNRKPTSIRR